MQPHLEAIVTASANDALDTAGELGRRIVLRELLAELRTLLSTPGNAGVTPDGRRARRLYQVIEAERANYAAAGRASAQYTFLGHTHQLQNQGTNHYYASRNGHNIEYSADFTRKDALDVLKHFVQTPNVPYAHATDVDNFICAFFAEPTRWREEQGLHTLATMRKGADADKIVYTNAGALAMAGGGTWDVGHGTLGRETPRRALDHATREGRFFIIDQEIVTAPNWVLS